MVNEKEWLEEYRDELDSRIEKKYNEIEEKKAEIKVLNEIKKDIINRKLDVKNNSK